MLVGQIGHKLKLHRDMVIQIRIGSIFMHPVIVIYPANLKDRFLHNQRFTGDVTGGVRENRIFSGIEEEFRVVITQLVINFPA